MAKRRNLLVPRVTRTTSRMPEAIPRQTFSEEKPSTMLQFASCQREVSANVAPFLSKLPCCRPLRGAERSVRAMKTLSLAGLVTIFR